MWPNTQFPADSLTFTEETPNGNLYFLCSFAYSQLFHVFIMHVDSCSNWKNQRYISSECAFTAASAMAGIKKRCYNLEFWFYLKPRQSMKHFEGRYDEYLYIFLRIFFANIKLPDPITFNPIRFFRNRFTLTPPSSTPPLKSL